MNRLVLHAIKKDLREAKLSLHTCERLIVRRGEDWSFPSGVTLRQMRHDHEQALRFFENLLKLVDEW